jgi:hypothetical protein
VKQKTPLAGGAIMSTTKKAEKMICITAIILALGVLRHPELSKP